MIFGITPSTCSEVIDKMLHLVVRKLKRREPKVDDVIGFMNGLSLVSECTSEVFEQNAMYNGYHSETMVNNIIAYGPDGKVFLTAINFPGSWHDGSITANILPYIGKRIGNYKMCIDQGFPRSGDASFILVRPISRRQARCLAANLREYLLTISNVYVSLWQASEWGMRGLQGTFPRFKKRLPGNAFKHSLVIQSIVFIHNFRTALDQRTFYNCQSSRECMVIYWQ